MWENPSHPSRLPAALSGAAQRSAVSVNQLKAAIRCGTHQGPLGGTFPTLTFGHVADAAFARSCSRMDFAVQQVSPEQPFKRIEYGGT